MPKTKLQNVIFTIIMAFVMVYAMVCYNIALDKGGMSNEIFLLAFHEIPIISHGFRRNEDYVAGCICSGIVCRRTFIKETGFSNCITGR